MRVERMLAIITYLLHHEKVKAKVLAEKFEVSIRTIYRDKWDGEFDDERHSPIVLAFDKGMKHAIYDVFGAENYEYMEDGRLKVSFRMAKSNWLYGFILGFGDKVEVIEPVEVRNEVMNMAESVSQIYKPKGAEL